MSQVFSADSVTQGATQSLPTSGETTAVMGNFLNPPFQNAKAIVFANVVFNAGTSTTNVVLRIRRNPNAENFLVSASTPVQVSGTNTVTWPLNAADVIPDGRPVQYAVTLLPSGATAAGNIVTANISVILISG